MWRSYSNPDPHGFKKLGNDLGKFRDLKGKCTNLVPIKIFLLCEIANIKITKIACTYFGDESLKFAPAEIKTSYHGYTVFSK
jgi:hypothetical protein